MPILIPPRGTTVKSVGVSAPLIGGTKVPETAKTSFSVSDDLPGLITKLQRFADQINKELSTLRGFPLLGGVLHKSVEFEENQDTTINHGLGKPVKWWLLVGHGVGTTNPYLRLQSTDSNVAVFRSQNTATGDLYLVAE